MNNQEPAVAIIVPFGEWNQWVIECVQAIAALNGMNERWTCWLVPDHEPDENWSRQLPTGNPQCRIEILATGPGNPAQKRNAVLRVSRDPIIALIDSDAWPEPDWLTTALSHLIPGGSVPEGSVLAYVQQPGSCNYARTDPSAVGVVAGPNLTPPHDPLIRRVGGRIMESPLGFGEGSIRHVAVAARDVREMPTCNMVFRRVNGMAFHESLDTGEDMVFCADMRAAGYRVRYQPDVRVYHHRRAVFIPFMRQCYRYGRDKGRLRRRHSDGAYAWQAIPALFVIYLLLAPLISLFFGGGLLKWLPWLPLTAYALAMLAESLRLARSCGEFLLAPAAFLAAHLAYGAGYLSGWVRSGK